MKAIPEEIVNFIKEHHVLSLATSLDESVWCAPVFYAFDVEEAAFIFTSDINTHHVEHLCHNCFVGGSIVLETKRVGTIQGLQLQGVATQLDGQALAHAKQLYIRCFPMARFLDTNLWRLDATLLKFTNNRLGFGKKLYWYRNESMEKVASLGSLLGNLKEA